VARRPDSTSVFVDVLALPDTGAVGGMHCDRKLSDRAALPGPL